jgi:hypothetical protein
MAEVYDTTNTNHSLSIRPDQPITTAYHRGGTSTGSPGLLREGSSGFLSIALVLPPCHIFLVVPVIPVIPVVPDLRVQVPDRRYVSYLT